MLKKIMLALLFFAVVTAGLWQLSKSRSYQLFGKIVSEVQTTKKVVALTFDDGPWNNEYTNQVLGILKAHGIKATFFLNGRGIESNFQATQNIILNGHEIGNHSYSHNRLVLKSLKEIAYEVDSTNTLIRSAGYSGEITFRPPYGKKLFTLPYYLHQKNMTTVTWNIEPETYEDVRKSPVLIAEYVNQNVKPGSIILLHVLGKQNDNARQSLPLIIKELKERGFKFVTVSELLNINT